MTVEKDRSKRRAVRSIGSAIALIWRADRRLVVVTGLLQLLAGSGTAALLLTGRRALETVLRADSIPEGIRLALPLLGALLCLMAVLSFVTAAHTGLHKLLVERTIRYFSETILEVAGSVELDFFESSEFYDRLKRAQENGVQTPLQVAINLPAITGSLLIAIGLVVVVVTIEPLLIPIMIVGVLPLWLVSARNSEDMYSFSFGHTPGDRVRQHLAALLTTKETAAEVRAFRTAEFLRGRWNTSYEERLNDVRKLVRRFLRRSLLGSLGSTLMTGISIGALLFLLATQRMEAAGAIAGLIAVQQLGSNLQQIARSAGMMYESALYLEDYRRFLALKHPDQPIAAGVAPFERLDVEHLTFRYPGSEAPAVADVSMHISKGEVIALVGENGSGKTTLAKLLCGLYHPEAGQILWDGTDLGTLDPRSFSRNIAVIFQDFVRYRLSVNDNISVGDVSREYDPNAIAEAAQSAGAADFIDSLPNKYDTMLAKEFEGGVDLSVGQWQRVALARAFFRDASFIVLDEPTASLDARAEHELFENIKVLCKNRAVLLISHRFSTVRSADRIYVLDKGRVVESGNHAELMRIGGRYSEMFTLQASSYVDQPEAPVSA